MAGWARQRRAIRARSRSDVPPHTRGNRDTGPVGREEHVRVHAPAATLRHPIGGEGGHEPADTVERTTSAEPFEAAARQRAAVRHDTAWTEDVRVATVAGRGAVAQ